MVLTFSHQINKAIQMSVSFFLSKAAESNSTVAPFLASAIEKGSDEQIGAAVRKAVLIGANVAFKDGKASIDSITADQKNPHIARNTKARLGRDLQDALNDMNYIKGQIDLMGINIDA